MKWLADDKHGRGFLHSLLDNLSGGSVSGTTHVEVSVVDGRSSGLANSKRGQRENTRELHFDRR
jgi:hypothetical protein